MACCPTGGWTLRPLGPGPGAPALQKAHVSPRDTCTSLHISPRLPVRTLIPATQGTVASWGRNTADDLGDSIWVAE